MFFSKNYGIKSKIYAAFLTLLEQKFLLLLRKKKKKKKKMEAKNIILDDLLESFTSVLQAPYRPAT